MGFWQRDRSLPSAVRLHVGRKGVSFRTRSRPRRCQTAVGIVCIALSQIGVAHADCPSGTIATTAIDGSGICYGTINGAPKTLVPLMSACPAGMRSTGNLDNYKVCASLRGAPSVTAVHACPKATLPLMNYQGTTRCVTDSRVGKDQLFTSLDGCPVGYAPGTNSNGAAVCAQR